MNILMKKFIGVVPFLLVVLPAFISCNDSDMEVYVGEKMEDNKILEELASLNIKTQLDEDDIFFPFMKHMSLAGEPTYMAGGWANFVTGLEFKEGYYGYTDLGLSVKWSVTNLNNPLDKGAFTIPSFDELYQSAIEGIEPVAFPGIDISEKTQYPMIMSYEEYVKRVGNKTINRETVENYKKYVELMNEAYEQSVSVYNTMNSNLLSQLSNRGSGYAWGGINNEIFACSGEDSPQNIAGNPKYDIAARYMGDGWRLPTRAEWQELVDKCQWEEYRFFYIITGPSGKTLLLPKSDNAYIKNYCTSERSDKMGSSNKYDIYEFSPKEGKIKQRDVSDFYYSYVRPVYSK